MVSLASSIHASPNTYALLLGSGISVSSGVPTGWGVTLDLVERLAKARGEDTGDDPVLWYRNQTEGDPDYSALLTELAPSQGDRRNLLEQFFQPSEEDREQSEAPYEGSSCDSATGCGRFRQGHRDDELRPVA